MRKSSKKNMSQIQNKKIRKNRALLLLVALDLFVMLVGCRHHCNVDINHIPSQDSSLTVEILEDKNLSLSKLGYLDINDGLCCMRSQSSLFNENCPQR